MLPSKIATFEPLKGQYARDQPSDVINTNALFFYLACLLTLEGVTATRYFSQFLGKIELASFSCINKISASYKLPLTIKLL